MAVIDMRWAFRPAFELIETAAVHESDLTQYLDDVVRRLQQISERLTRIEHGPTSEAQQGRWQQLTGRLDSLDTQLGNLGTALVTLRREYNQQQNDHRESEQQVV